MQFILPLFNTTEIDISLYIILYVNLACLAIYCISLIWKITRYMKMSAQELIDSIKQTKDSVKHNRIRHYLTKQGEINIPVLMTAISDENDDVRSTAIQILSNMCSQTKEAIPGLINVLSDENWRVYQPAMETLTKLGDRAVSYLVVGLIYSDDHLTRSRSAEILGKIGSVAQSSIPQLIKALSDNHELVRSKAVEALGNMGEVARSVVPNLVYMLLDPQTGVRIKVIEALGKIGQIDESTVSILFKRLSNRDWVIRGRTAVALGQAKSLDSTTILGLIQACTDRYFYVSSEAEKSLDIINPEWHSTLIAQSAIPFLIRKLSTKYSSARNATIEILIKIGHTATKDLLPEMKSRKRKVRRAVAQILEKIAKGNLKAIPALAPALADAHDDVRQAAAVALEQIHRHWHTTHEAQKAIPSLVEKLVDVHITSHDLAIELLKKINPQWYTVPQVKEAVPTLANALSHPYPRIRISAGEILCRLGVLSSAAVPTLIRALSDRYNGVRKAAAEALGAIGNPAMSAIPALTALQSDDSLIVRRIASESLQKIQEDKTVI